MLEILNNKWTIIISIIILYLIIKKIFNLCKPIDVEDYYNKQINQKKLKEKITLKNLNITTNDILSYYLGL